ncbi:MULTISPECIES: rhomboid family intramembrane serine protease [Lactobacillus]|uniref:Rhomboid family intramembrane serine protease n=1 Tax=Lactobacillus xujianguonis TaxID=2495899 RepID=A0A437ST14_9LACO|nr:MULTISPECIES: rhomboid family intramembrane serine protease [Lactobacillus]RVU70070.1 rhomboid family intramembrane serine protease [Lactobacillus xujianguonis]RVU77649.1 rhomboid family intramembrane serine protease [Lactobacillus xujianguonis]
MKQKINLSGSFVTLGILIVLLVVFVAEVFLGGSENSATLMKMGAMNNYAVVAGGQWWRLFTAQFLHIGVMHLVSNAVIIYYMGLYMEPLLGHWRFLIVYLLSGIGGNLLSLAFGSDAAVSAGASTALFGLFGAMTAVGLRNLKNPLISYLGRQAFVLALINLGLDIFVPNIDIQGHIGGFIAGFLLAIICGDRTMKEYNPKWRVLAGAVLVVYVVLTVRQGMVINF